MRDTLLSALPLFARMVNGYALLADDQGRILRLVDRFGRPYRELEHQELPPFVQRGEDGLSGIPCPLNKDLMMWAIPLDAQTLCVSESQERLEIHEQLQKTFREALPSIARVVGGEAVLFDRQGVRLQSVNSRGQYNHEYMGRVSESARRCMETQQTLVGDSTYTVGAKAVRIPVCGTFGVGFNNNDAVTQRQQLLDGIHQNKRAQARFRDIAGHSETVQSLREAAQIAAATDASVLILGEPGSGKAMLAQAIHNDSPRRAEPFVSVSCDSMAQDLLEGVLFGFQDAALQEPRRGADTGALAAADGGTLLLHHIHRMDRGIQQRLLQVMEEGAYSPGGDDALRRPVNVRILATAGPDLAEQVEQDRFHLPLFRLLSATVLTTPSLSKIPEDLPVLVNCFVERLNLQQVAAVERVDDEAMALLREHPWPGNAGELYGALEFAFAHIGSSTVLRKYHLPPDLLREPRPQDPPGADAAGPSPIPIERMLDDYEAQIIKHALLSNRGSRQVTAEQLGISKPSLWRKMKKLQIEL